MRDIEVLAIIPARGHSKRLPRKNLYPILGVPMIAWVIRACREAFERAPWVTSEDAQIRAAAIRYGAHAMERPAHLAQDYVPKWFAAKHAIDTILMQGLLTPEPEPQVVAIVQPNSPELTPEDLISAMLFMRNYHLWEVISASENGVQNGAFRFMTMEAVRYAGPSVHCGFWRLDCIDVHTEADAKEAELRLELAQAPKEMP